MSKSIEWRTRGELDDSLIAVDRDNTVGHVWRVEPALLADFLNEMLRFQEVGSNGTGGGTNNPQDFGELVIARAPDGDVIHVNPELYWNGVTSWFRSRGTDPHIWRRAT